jgi:glutathione S-transferase
MANISVYGSPFGTSFRVHWMLKELDLPYEHKPLNMAAGEHKTAEYLALNPMGQVPVIVVDDVVLTESIAITHYLAAKFKPELLGATLEDQAHALRFSVWNMLNLNPHFGMLARPTWSGQPLAPEVLESTLAGLAKYLPILEERLNGQEWIVGNMFSIADIDLRATFAYGEAANFDFSPYPNIEAWLKRTSERPSFIAAKS